MEIMFNALTRVVEEWDKWRTKFLKEKRIRHDGLHSERYES